MIIKIANAIDRTMTATFSTSVMLKYPGAGGGEIVELYDGVGPRVILGSVWAIGTGLIMLVNGSLIASSYAKTTTMNYAGFGLLLAGTGVFVYGMFETARFSAMGYLNFRRIKKP